MKRKSLKRALCMLSATMLGVVAITGCGTDKSASSQKVLKLGDTTFNAENDEKSVNPHDGYSGWACIRYGIGETLFKYSKSMELQPWLAKDYKHINDKTWVIKLKDKIKFTSGRSLDAQAVKECLQDLIKINERAKGDLKIASIKAKGLTLTIRTTESVPAFINYLSDPYGCIIDMKAGEKDRIVAGTGPYKAVSVKTDKGVSLEKNTSYWNGTPKLDKIEVKTITDGDTLTLSLQSGEINAAYGLPYNSLKLFKNEKQYTISSADTSRTFFGQFNYKTKALQDKNVRRAIAAAMDKKNYVSVLLNGNGVVANGPFTAESTASDTKVKAIAYNLSNAKKLLEKAGYKDTNKDGYVDRDGKNLTLRWLTYPSRQELPVLAESMQASLKKIGVKLVITNTASYQNFLDKGKWDIYGGAFVTAPTGDPEYFFTTHALKASTKNRGGYHSAKLETLEKQMMKTFDLKKRGALGIQMAQTILDDQAFVFASHLKMSIVTGSKVTGLEAHPSDYYEITANTDIQ